MTWWELPKMKLDWLESWTVLVYFIYFVWLVWHLGGDMDCETRQRTSPNIIWYIYIYIHMIIHVYITDSLLLALYDAFREIPQTIPDSTWPCSRPTGDRSMLNWFLEFAEALLGEAWIAEFRVFLVRIFPLFCFVGFEGINLLGEESNHGKSPPDVANANDEWHFGGTGPMLFGWHQPSIIRDL